ncbi:unnamed protein product [Angiostrongylus costaricensis]|uniref:SH3 domain-containing protein n=1 Tax=Angiostrongylus costaricensis TaxID=334426 RepID=A0A158PHL0_ANGCS|nr:unnamed protein product [Angiostrongylus costaricensis]
MLSSQTNTTFSVSAAKAFFEAAKKPEVRQAAVAAAKNPFVRQVAKQAATNPETRQQLVAALEKHYVKVSSSDFCSTQPHAIVKHSFNGSHQDELSCAAGDIIILKRDVDDQWIYGMNNRTRGYGIVPLSFLDIRVPLSFSSPPSAAVIATAIYDYFSNTPGDLTFRMHDQIIATERIGPEWLRGSLNGREGIFPANFVSCPNIDSLPMSQPATQMAHLEKMTAAYDYSSGVQGDLEFKAEVIARLDQDWIQGRVNGNEGLCPLSFLAPYGTPVKSPKTRGLASIAFSGYNHIVKFQTVTAIADHYTDDPKMLYFSKGERIIIVEDVDTYWYRGKVEGFKTLPAGLFPKAIVKED